MAEKHIYLDGLTKQDRYRLRKLSRGVCLSCTREREDKAKGHCNVCLQKMKARRRAKC